MQKISIVDVRGLTNQIMPFLTYFCDDKLDEAGNLDYDSLCCRQLTLQEVVYRLSLFRPRVVQFVYLCPLWTSEGVEIGKWGFRVWAIRFEITMKIWADGLEQWFPTGLPWGGAKGAANSYNSVIFIPRNQLGCRQIPLILSKGAANQKRLGSTGLGCLLSPFEERRSVIPHEHHRGTRCYRFSDSRSSCIRDYRRTVPTMNSIIFQL